MDKNQWRAGTMGGGGGVDIKGKAQLLENVSFVNSLYAVLLRGGVQSCKHFL